MDKAMEASAYAYHELPYTISEGIISTLLWILNIIFSIPWPDICMCYESWPYYRLCLSDHETISKSEFSPGYHLESYFIHRLFTRCLWKNYHHVTGIIGLMIISLLELYHSNQWHNFLLITRYFHKLNFIASLLHICYWLPADF